MMNLDLKRTVSSVGLCILLLCFIFLHLFSTNLVSNLSTRSAKVKALMKEMRQLTSSLPVSASASIFVKQVSTTLSAHCSDAGGICFIVVTLSGFY